MTRFGARLIELGGKRAAELSFVLNDHDRHPRKVVLVAERELRGFAPLPFTWRYLNETAERPYPVLTVVAAPGVSVLLENFPPGGIVGMAGIPDLNVYRVQDPAVLPRLATDPSSFALVGSTEVAEREFPPEGASGLSLPRLDLDRHFKVDRLPSSVVITHFGSGDQWTIKVPQFTNAPPGAERLDARARYAYEIDLGGAPGDSAKPLLKIVKTPAVTLTVDDTDTVWSLFGRNVRPGFGLVYWQVWEVDDLDDVPALGAPIVPGDRWRPVTRVARGPASVRRGVSLEEVIFDVGIGAIPVVGDIVDLAELALGLVTGKDKWGNKLSTGDLAILGIGLLLPFVGSAALRRGRQLLRRFGQHALEAGELAERLRRAGVSAQDAELIQAMEAAIRAGRVPPGGAWTRAAEILGRVPGAQPPTVDVLLNLERTGFAHAELQESYRAYAAAQAKAGRAAADPGEWARRVTTGRPRRVLEALLGPDYARRAAGVDAPPINLVDIPRPAGYTDEVLAAQREFALANGGKLGERLDVLFDAPVDAGAEALGLVRRNVNAGHFRIFKGNLAEVFAHPVQLDILRGIAAREPGAKLVSGVRMRLVENGKLSSSRLFSDNIVLVERQGRVEVLAVCEVKAGFKGGQEATEQIFEWIEGRITDGSQLVIPRGSRFIDELGNVTAAEREIVLTWRPGRRDVPTVTGLASAERHLITARGASHLGANSAMGVAPNVTSHVLPISSAELDYLAGTLLGRITRTPRPPALPVDALR